MYGIPRGYWKRFFDLDKKNKIEIFKKHDKACKHLNLNKAQYKF